MVCVFYIEEEPEIESIALSKFLQYLEDCGRNFTISYSNDRGVVEVKTNQSIYRQWLRGFHEAWERFEGPSTFQGDSDAGEAGFEAAKDIFKG